jgi:hypothetical protein
MKYKLTEEKMQTPFGELVRIEALRDFLDVKKGEKGGFIMLEKNLSHYGDAWVYGDARVYGNARVYGDAQVWFDTSDVKYLCVGPFGNTFRYITITKSEVRAGCFSGNLGQFKIAVMDKYGEDFGTYSDAITICESFMNKTT